MLLETALVMDPNSHIKSNDPSCSQIDKVANIARMKNIDKYAIYLQTNTIKKQFVYFVPLKTTISFQNLKLSKEMYAWLKDNKIYIMQHAMQMNHTTPIGYLLGMHPTLSSGNAMKLLLDGYIPPDIEYHLIMTSTFYITQKGKKVNTHIAEVHVNSQEAKHAKEIFSDCWLKEVFVKELEECSMGMMINFIPNIQKRVMDVLTFHKTLCHQTKFAGNIDNFRMNTGYGRYGATYNMVGFSCFNEELSLLPTNPTEAKLQATSTRGESTEPTKGVVKHTYKAVLYNYCLMQYCCILFYQLVSREVCNPNQWEKVSKSMDSSSIGNR
jgi:hypothetical protein